MNSNISVNTNSLSIFLFFEKNEILKKIKLKKNEFKHNVVLKKLNPEEVNVKAYLSRISFFQTSIFIISVDFFLKYEREINFFLRFNDKHKSNLSILLIYKDDSEIKQLSSKENIWCVLIKESNLEFLLFKVLSNKIDILYQNYLTVSDVLKTEALNKALLQIALEIGTKQETEDLLHTILIKTMEITNADAGTISLKGYDKFLQKTDDNILTFYTSFNYSKKLKFNRFSLSINESSLTGYSVVHKKIINISDAYELSKELHYSFDRSFDLQTGFRTKSVLVVPMLNKTNRVFGAIQLINKKKNYTDKIRYSRFNLDKVLPFSKRDEKNIQAIANFASVSMENALLYKEIEASFESFVKASVYAVEQRDPATSGHSGRVANHCINLAKACNKAKGILSEFNLDDFQLKELRYAALLHDFGKIGVEERVLVKEKKLDNSQLTVIKDRFRIYILQKELEVEREKIELIKNSNLTMDDLKKRLAHLEQSLKKEYSKVKEYIQHIEEANEPTILDKRATEVLHEVMDLTYEIDNEIEPILKDDEFQFLNIKRGSLSQKERLEIESHVTQSFLFLQKIPWGQKLKNIPEIAYGHHEKLDGSGYPQGISSEEIRPQSKLMTVCDIYDALVASDRPYKKAISSKKALEILHLEANDGKLDKRLVDIMGKVVKMSKRKSAYSS